MNAGGGKSPVVPRPCRTCGLCRKKAQIPEEPDLTVLCQSIAQSPRSTLRPIAAGVVQSALADKSAPSHGDVRYDRVSSDLSLSHKRDFLMAPSPLAASWCCRQRIRKSSHARDRRCPGLGVASNRQHSKRNQFRGTHAQSNIALDGELSLREAPEGHGR